MINENKIKIVKLTSGEDILCEYQEGNHHVTLTNPFKIVVIPSRVAGQQPSIGLTPWCPFSSDNSFEVHFTHIVTKSQPEKQFVEEYKRMMSPILQADKPPLIIPGL